MLGLQQKVIFESVAERPAGEAIGRRLGICPTTVETYQFDMMNMVGAHDLVELSASRPYLAESCGDRICGFLIASIRALPSSRRLIGPEPLWAISIRGRSH